MKLGEWAPRKGDVLRLRNVTSLVPVFRQFRSMHNLSDVPSGLSLTLHGAVIPQVPWLDDEAISFKEIEPTVKTTKEGPLRVGVDTGWLDYLDSLPHSKCDRYQELSALSFTHQVLGLDPGSSSISIFVGPQGKGKTNVLLIVIGAFLHHSKAGHFKPGARHRTVLHPNDSPSMSPMCYSDNPDGIRILITCSSNETLDDVENKVRKGIPLKNGCSLVPAMVCIALQWYKYGNLDDVSFRTLGRKYDEAVLGEEAQSRNNPSKKALEQLAVQTILFFCTCSTAESNIFQDLEANISVQLIDEAAHTSDVEAITSISGAVKCMHQERMHVFMTGDHKQLSPVFHSVWYINDFL